MKLHDFFIHFPNTYAFLCYCRRIPNFEKILYLRNIKKNQVVFDIGANIGVYTKLFSQLSGENGTVHSFEPVPETFQLLIDSVAGSKNIRANNLAAGDTEGMMNISYDPKNSEKSSLLGPQNNINFVRTVKVLALDTYAQDVNLERLDFLKCDVEGFELKALKGIQNTLAKYHPKISIEVTLPYDQKLELFDLLVDIGYDQFQKIERGFPTYATDQDTQQEGDYFYLYATSSLAS